MSRRARLSLEGGVFHVVSRFAGDTWWLDRAGARDAYLDYLGEAASRGGVEVLAYCLMSNHVHLVVVQGERPLERFMKSLHTGFAGWAHRGARGRKARGPVFAERPRTVLVERDAYLLELVRYVHNNPVRAGVARFARSSEWSSHQAYIGKVEAPDWLRMGYVLERFDKHVRRAASAFDAFVDEGRKHERRPDLSGALDVTEAATVRRALGDGHRVTDGIVGSAAFVAKVMNDTERVTVALSSRRSATRWGKLGRPTVRQVIDAVLRQLDTDALELDERPKSQKSGAVKRLAVWTWVHEYEGKQSEVARALQIDSSMVSRYYGQALERAGEFDEAASAVTAVVRRPRASQRSQVTPASADGHRVRYFVDVDET